jgi:hypothetical protein
MIVAVAGSVVVLLIYGPSSKAQRGSHARPGHSRTPPILLCSRRKLLEQRLGLLKIERIKPFGEPAMDRSEKIAGFIPLALITLEPCHAHRRAQIPQF